MTFVGSAPPKEIANAASGDGNIKVTGFVDDVRPYMDEAAVMVVPLRIGSGTRLKILDAMAMGKAIVSTSVGCEGLQVSDDENILISDTPKDFVQKVIKLLQDDSLRFKIEKNARKVAESYSWASIMDKQDWVYQSVIERSNL
jgi:polysaccharide biosynthesis protein PslH